MSSEIIQKCKPMIIIIIIIMMIFQHVNFIFFTKISFQLF